jgi:hypothetical protein
MSRGECSCGKEIWGTFVVEVFGTHQHASMSAVDVHLPLATAWFGTQTGLGIERKRV